MPLTIWGAPLPPRREVSYEPVPAIYAVRRGCDSLPDGRYGRTRLQVRLQGETVWLTQAQLAELFQRERSVITKHIRNVFTEGELVESAVCATYAQTAADGNLHSSERRFYQKVLDICATSVDYTPEAEVSRVSHICRVIANMALTPTDGAFRLALACGPTSIVRLSQC